MEKRDNEVAKEHECEILVVWIQPSKSQKAANSLENEASTSTQCWKQQGPKQ